MKRIASILTVAAVAFALGWWARGARIDASEEVIVRIDTVYYARPQIAAVTSRPVTLQVPRLIFGGVTTDPAHCSAIPTGSRDSVAVRVELETRVYEDSLYRAQVSGPALGELRPALDWVEVRGRTVYKTVARPYSWEAGPAAGAWYCPAGSGVWLGAEVRRTVGRLSVGAAGGYDPRNAGPFVELRASLSLWRR